MYVSPMNDNSGNISSQEKTGNLSFWANLRFNVNDQFTFGCLMDFGYTEEMSFGGKLCRILIMFI
jgi:hypothetical protein